MTEHRPIERMVGVLEAAAQPLERGRGMPPDAILGRKGPVTTCTRAHGEKWRKGQGLEAARGSGH